MSFVMRYGLQGRFGLYYGQEWDKDKVLLHVAASAATAENASIVELGLWIIIKLGVSVSKHVRMWVVHYYYYSI